MKTKLKNSSVKINFRKTQRGGAYKGAKSFTIETSLEEDEDIVIDKISTPIPDSIAKKIAKLLHKIKDDSGKKDAIKLQFTQLKNNLAAYLTYLEKKKDITKSRAISTNLDELNRWETWLNNPDIIPTVYYTEQVKTNSNTTGRLTLEMYEKTIDALESENSRQSDQQKAKIFYDINQRIYIIRDGIDNIDTLNCKLAEDSNELKILKNIARLSANDLFKKDDDMTRYILDYIDNNTFEDISEFEQIDDMFVYYLYTIIMNNVPAFKIGKKFLKRLDPYLINSIKIFSKFMLALFKLFGIEVDIKLEKMMLDETFINESINTKLDHMFPFIKKSNIKNANDFFEFIKDKIMNDISLAFLRGYQELYNQQGSYKNQQQILTLKVLLYYLCKHIKEIIKSDDTNEKIKKMQQIFTFLMCNLMTTVFAIESFSQFITHISDTSLGNFIPRITNITRYLTELIRSNGKMDKISSSNRIMFPEIAKMLEIKKPEGYQPKWDSIIIKISIINYKPSLKTDTLSEFDGIIGYYKKNVSDCQEAIDELYHMMEENPDYRISFQEIDEENTKPGLVARLKNKLQLLLPNKKNLTEGDLILSEAQKKITTVKDSEYNANQTPTRTFSTTRESGRRRLGRRLGKTLVKGNRMSAPINDDKLQSKIMDFNALFNKVLSKKISETTLYEINKDIEAVEKYIADYGRNNNTETIRGLDEKLREMRERQQKLLNLYTVVKREPNTKKSRAHLYVNVPKQGQELASGNFLRHSESVYVNVPKQGQELESIKFFRNPESEYVNLKGIQIPSTSNAVNSQGYTLVYPSGRSQGISSSKSVGSVDSTLSASRV